jgi:hypothetical protein
MYETEDFVMLMVKERMHDDLRYAEQRRALRLARVPRPSMRVRLGTALIRFGQWMMGESAPSAGSQIGIGQAQY